MATYNATDMVELKPERLFEVSTHYVRCTQKTLFLTTFFTNLPKGSPHKVIRRAKRDQRVSPLSVALGSVAYQFFGTNVNFGGDYENATTFWIGFRNR